ncbi:MAG: glutamine synthetase, partial [Dehalococcoidia bacterium]|nr:glutamine synthetase [Dehalococcoidia bacterium]
FYDENDARRLSSTGKHFLAGLLRHGTEITAITNQWVNSYKRLIPGLEAPTYSAWTEAGWGDLVRVPAYRPGRQDSVRIEYRSPDSACNPYLAFSAILAAGLEGIEKEYPLPNPVAEDLDSMSDKELESLGARRLPGNLQEAIRALEDSDIARHALGDRVFESFLRNKRIEWQEYES